MKHSEHARRVPRYLRGTTDHMIVYDEQPTSLLVTGTQIASEPGAIHCGFSDALRWIHHLAFETTISYILLDC